MYFITVLLICSHIYSIESNFFTSKPGVSDPGVRLPSDGLAVMRSLLFLSTGANPFWQMDHGRVVSTLATAVSGEMYLWDSVLMDSISRFLFHFWKSIFIFTKYHYTPFLIYVGLTLSIEPLSCMCVCENSTHRHKTPWVRKVTLASSIRLLIST